MAADWLSLDNVRTALRLFELGRDLIGVAKDLLGADGDDAKRRAADAAKDLGAEVAKALADVARLYSAIDAANAALAKLPATAEGLLPGVSRRKPTER